MGSVVCCLANPLSKTPDLARVPPTPAITADWLTETLRRAGRLTVGQRVASLTMAQLAASASDGTAMENGGGLAGGAVVRITGITYEGVDADAEALPRALIHKWCSASEILQALSTKDRFWAGLLIHLGQYYGVRQELTVYRDLAEELRAAGVALPRTLYAALDDGGHTDTLLCCAMAFPHRPYLRSSVLCEDMGERGFAAGVVTSGPRMTHRDALTAATTMARIHAWGWGGRGRGEPESQWTALVAGHNKLSHRFLKKFQTDTTLQKFLDLWSSRDHAADLQDEGVRQLLWDLRANFNNWFQRGCDMPRDQTLLHGDFHVGNIFIRKDGATEPDDVTVIDWAYLGTGHVSWELNYFLTLSCGGSHEEDMEVLAAYHAELIARNPSIDYTLEALQADCKLTLFMQTVGNILDKSSKSKVREYYSRVEEGGSARDIALVNDILRQRIHSRLAGYYASNDWGDYFSGARSADGAGVLGGAGGGRTKVGYGVSESLIK